MTVYIAVLLPAIAALWCAHPRSARSAPIVTALCVSVSFLLAILVAIHVSATGGVIPTVNWVQVDGFGAILMLLIAAVACSATIYSIGYLAHLEPSPRRIRLYYANFALFVVSMLAIAVCIEPGVVWIAVELTTLLSVLLVSFTDTPQALEAAWKYMVITLMGATVAMLGILVLFWAQHVAGGTTFTYAGLASDAHRMNPALVAAAFALLLIGFGAKVGLFPMHTWLPDAHSQAPAPVCAMLSGVETSAVLYVLLRLSPVFRAIPSIHMDLWFGIFGAASLVAAAFLILQTHDLKRLFAFSTVEHMGVMLLAASIATSAGNLGTIWQMLAHALTKSLCFFAAGAVGIIAGTTELAKLRGFQGRSPGTGAVLLTGALAIAGSPPFALFLSEVTIALAAILSGKIWIAAVLLLFVGIAFVGMISKVASVLFGRSEEVQANANVPKPAAYVMAAAVVPVIVLGLWIPTGLGALLTQAAAQMMSP
jgi:hydrogenase-4 component F